MTTAEKIFHKHVYKNKTNVVDNMEVYLDMINEALDYSKQSFEQAQGKNIHISINEVEEIKMSHNLKEFELNGVFDFLKRAHFIKMCDRRNI